MNDDNPSRRDASIIDRELHERGAKEGASLTTRLWRAPRAGPDCQRLASWCARRNDWPSEAGKRGIPVKETASGDIGARRDNHE